MSWCEDEPEPSHDDLTHDEKLAGLAHIGYTVREASAAAQVGFDITRPLLHGHRSGTSRVDWISWATR